MDLELLLLAFAMFWKMSSAIRCHICSPEKNSGNEAVPLCQYFNNSDVFITDCPHSTVCFKKETSLVGLGDPTKSIQRGCAHQLIPGYQEKIDGHWKHVDKIHEHEAYTEGCHENSNEFGRATKTLRCFCRGDLCNSDSGVKAIASLLFTTVFLLIVL